MKQNNDEYKAQQILCPFFGLVYLSSDIICAEISYNCSKINCQFRKSFICSVDISTMYNDLIDITSEARL